MGLFRRGQVWWMRFKVQGRLERRSTRTTNRKLAQRVFDRVKGELAEGLWFQKLPGEDKTFKEMMEKYMVEHSSRNKAPKSHKRDKSLRDHLVGFFGDFTLVEVTPSLIAEYKTKRHEEGAAAKTINNELILMGHAFNLAVKEWEWLRENPVRKVSKEKVRNFIERWLTLEEEAKLLGLSPEWLQEIITFAIHTGLRQSEILDLKWSNVNLTVRTMRILEQKNQGVDTLPLCRKSILVLEDRSRVRQPETDFVFYSQVGSRIDARNLQRAFDSAVAKSGVERLRFHDLRHTFATRLIQNGVDIYAVQKLGRWKTISMVMRYAHHYPESLRSGIEVLDKVGKKVSTNLAQFGKIQ